MRTVNRKAHESDRAIAKKVEACSTIFKADFHPMKSERAGEKLSLSGN